MDPEDEFETDDEYETDDELTPDEWAAAIALRLAVNRDHGTSGPTVEDDALGSSGPDTDDADAAEDDDDDATEILVIVRTRSGSVHRSYIALDGAKIGKPKTNADDAGPLARLNARFGYLKKAAEKLMADTAPRPGNTRTLTVSDWRRDPGFVPDELGSARWEEGD